MPRRFCHVPSLCRNSIKILLEFMENLSVVANANRTEFEKRAVEKRRKLLHNIAVPEKKDHRALPEANS